MRDIKKSAHAIREVDKSKSCSVGQQPGEPGKPKGQVKSKDTVECPPALGSFFLFYLELQLN